MTRSTSRKKAAARKKRQHSQHGVPGGRAVPPGILDFVPRWDDAAEELLTSRGWISDRSLGMDEEGDGWQWMPSLLPTDLADGAEPSPTSVCTEFTSGASGFHADGLLRPWELVSDLLHYPDEEDPGDRTSPRSFRQMRRAHRLDLLPTDLCKTVVAGRRPQAPPTRTAPLRDLPG